MYIYIYHKYIRYTQIRWYEHTHIYIYTILPILHNLYISLWYIMHVYLAISHFFSQATWRSSISAPPRSVKPRCTFFLGTLHWNMGNWCEFQLRFRQISKEHQEFIDQISLEHFWTWEDTTKENELTMSLKLMREVWCTNQVTKRLQKVRVSNHTARKGEFSAFTDVSSSAHKCCRLWTLLSQHTGSCFHTKTVKFACQETSWMVKTPSPSLSLGERKWQCGSRLYHQLRATLRPPSTARPGKKRKQKIDEHRTIVLVPRSFFPAGIQTVQTHEISWPSIWVWE